MRSLIGSSLCVCAMFATGFSLVQEDELPRQTAEIVSPRSPRPVPPAPPATPAGLRQVRTSPGFENLFVQDLQDPFARTVRVNNGRVSTRNEVLRKKEHGLQSAITNASRMLRSDNADTKEKAQETLRKAVGELFDLRSKAREKQIKDLEERLAKLRKQMEQREDKKADIIRLHIQTIVNQANGLGF